MKRKKLNNAEMWAMMLDCLDGNDVYESCVPLIEKFLKCKGGRFTLLDLCYWWNPSRGWILNYCSFELPEFWKMLRETKSCTPFGGKHYKISREFRLQLEQILYVENLISD